TNAVLSDLDGDGDLDLICSSDTQSKVWLNDGSGKYIDAQVSGINVKPAYALDLGDADNDGDLDCIFGCSDISGIQGVRNELWINDGTGKFTKSTKANFKRDLTWSVKFGDMDGDGDLDIVEGNYPNIEIRKGMNRVWWNKGDGDFKDSGKELGNYWTLSIGLGDVDRDGDLDIVTGNTGDSNLIWFND
ncbi:MAG: FG-GAP repeat domain-containing protein, partial [Planctomycetota bacterium]